MLNVRAFKYYIVDYRDMMKLRSLKIDKLTLAMICGVAIVVGVFLYVLLVQHGPAVRCGTC
jgi:hypothetical protein